MYSVIPPSSSSFSSTEQSPRPFLVWQRIIDWAQEHYRHRTFCRDERIPSREGLLYLVQSGCVRLSSLAPNNTQVMDETPDEQEEGDFSQAFLGFVGAGEPFELVSRQPLTMAAHAHADQTQVIWMYWNELDNWPHFRREVMEGFRYQHQRKLLLLSALGQRRTIDRLLGFLTLLVEEYGEPSRDGVCLPWPLTHAQIGSAIGSTRVTVTRLMGRLRQQGVLEIQRENQICVPLDHLQKVGD
ncbi:MAG: Crp/Fnr family transcriptional regulator [Prochlorotrichaceae cyanobacterium]